MQVHSPCRLERADHLPRYCFKLRPLSRKTQNRCHAVASAEGGNKKVVVVGGGFAGFGAAKHLADQGYAVTLVDGAETPGGLSAGWRTPKGRAVEAGIKGFWYQYHNIFRLVKELDIEWPFTEWTTSGFWSPSGLTTSAPVFSSLPRFPALIGQFVHTAPLFWRLPLSERVTMLPWLLSVLDVNSSPEVFARYDSMTAKELFQRFHVSERMYNEFLRPTLLVGLFATPENLSAAAVVNTLYYYGEPILPPAIGLTQGSVSERIFLPLVERIKAAGGTIQGSTFVTDVAVDATRQVKSVTTRSKSGEVKTLEADAVVFAIGITGMQKLVSASQTLSSRPEFAAVQNLKSIDVISVRLWLDRKIDFQFPANVLAGFEKEAGSTFFDLNALQDEYKLEANSVIGSDFYGATELLGLSDEEIVNKVVRNIQRCDPRALGAKVVDSAVLKFSKAVTHFSPGCHTFMPEQQTSIRNCFIAGDWVKNIDHGANGLSQERAYVTGLRAANFVIGELGVGEPIEILQVEADEPHIAFGKQASKVTRSLLGAVGLERALLP